VTDTDGDGINFANADGAMVDFDNVWVSEAVGLGINFANADGAMADFTNVQVSETTDEGIGFFNADNAVVDFTNVWIADTGENGIEFGDADGLAATFTDVTFSGMIGSGDDYLFHTNGLESPAVSLNGNLINDTDNFTNGDDALCQGDFEGTVLVEDGVLVTITDGVGSDSVSCAAVPSDRRLKHDIRLLSTLDNGIGLYSFRYLWSDTEYVGVMAQDLVGDERYKNAAIMTPAGYYAVDYAKLGLRMTTLDAWRADGLDAVVLQARPGVKQAAVLMSAR
jgi:hypothetical protein